MVEFNNKEIINKEEAVIKMILGKMGTEIREIKWD